MALLFPRRRHIRPHPHALGRREAPPRRLLRKAIEIKILHNLRLAAPGTDVEDGDESAVGLGAVSLAQRVQLVARAVQIRHAQGLGGAVVEADNVASIQILLDEPVDQVVRAVHGAGDGRQKGPAERQLAGDRGRAVGRGDVCRGVDVDDGGAEGGVGDEDLVRVGDE